ncbi:MAG: Hpt domain-containing protein, partial [Desulfobacula sp.]
MSIDGHDPTDAMSSEFIAEIKDDLASLEPTLLAMEKKGSGTDEELINHAFRSIHSIKGGAGFINFKELSSLSHAMENVLMRIREKTLIIDSDIADALLAGFDKMKLMVEQIGKSVIPDYEQEKAALQHLLNPDQKFSDSRITPVSGIMEKPVIKSGQPIKPAKLRTKGKKQDISKDLSPDSFQVLKPLGPSPVFQGHEFKVDKKRFEHALSGQKFIYAVYVRFEADLKARNKDEDAIVDDIKSIGDILFSDLEQSRNEQGDNGFFCVISTILDLPLLSQVLEINKTQMTLVDRQFSDYEILMRGIASRVSKEKPEPELKIPNLMKPVVAESDEAVIHGTSESATFLSSTAQTIRINVDLISRLMNRAGELVLVRNQLRPFLSENAKENNLASGIMQNLDMVTTDIQEAVMQMRMQPIVDLMGKYKRVVRDIARRISKKVDFILEGGDVEVDRTVLEKLANPVTHLIRNCIDHGIETPEERIRRSKPETGIIRIKASHQGGQVHITISDDGAGI